MRRPVTGYALVVVLIICVSLCVAAAALSLAANTRSEKRETAARHASERTWCSVIITLDDSYRETPPSTSAGKNVAEGIARLRTQFRCPPPKE
jgi:type II secretory pathway component PulK